ncbi:L,D-transpeptidase family protein [Streptomyces sp. NPDC056707]|uniref:L,D-transpeptidase family protein n=1 Tax=Streptomyces sp. NPDC056707 TaxID=3345919 RepID=UPI0036BE859D
MQSISRRVSTLLVVASAMALATSCGQQGQAESVGEATPGPATTTESPTGKSPSPSESSAASATAASSPSASAATKASAESTGPTTATHRTTAAARGTSAAPAAPSFPVPVSVGNSTQIITVKASGSYATVTAWAKGASGWKAAISANGRVGSNGVTDGATRRQSTYTTPTGTYTITEGFGVESGDTSMPYTRVNSSHWWVEDPESAYYNSMHSAAGADFPLVETGERGSEHLINYPTQYAKALVINFNRWPATPGRGAGIFLHVNGSGATAGCVSVPRPTMDRIMAWIQPGAHPRIAIG